MSPPGNLAPAPVALAATAVPALSRKEAERIRMREGDPVAVAAWIDRALRIRAPTPPREGPLLPSQTGWLVARGSVDERLWPDFHRWLGGTSVTAVLAWKLVRHALHAWLGIGIAVGGVVVLAGLGLRDLLSRSKLSRWRDHALLLPPDPASSPPDDHSLVRLVGQIAPMATMPSLFRGCPAVLARNKVGSVDETRGLDFEVELGPGIRVSVEVREAVLLDPPTRLGHAPACGPVSAQGRHKGEARLQSDLLSPPSFWTRWQRLHESSVGPGDLVEIVGHIEREGGRTVIYGTSEVPLLVRTVAGVGLSA